MPLTINGAKQWHPQVATDGWLHKGVGFPWPLPYMSWACEGSPERKTLYGFVWHSGMPRITAKMYWLPGSLINQSAFRPHRQEPWRMQRSRKIQVVRHYLTLSIVIYCYQLTSGKLSPSRWSWILILILLSGWSERTLTHLAPGDCTELRKTYLFLVYWLDPNTSMAGEPNLKVKQWYGLLMLIATRDANLMCFKFIFTPVFLGAVPSRPKSLKKVKKTS
jgi:hypothetical protein